VTISSPLYLTDTFKLNKSEYKLQAETTNIKKFNDPKYDFESKWIYFDLQETIKLKIAFNRFSAYLFCLNPDYLYKHLSALTGYWAHLPSSVEKYV
jgi:hypothetical protein